jgi:hypothetical protein
MFTFVLSTGEAVGGSRAIPDFVSVIVEKLKVLATLRLFISIDKPTLVPFELSRLNPLVRQTR